MARTYRGQSRTRAKGVQSARIAARAAKHGLPMARASVLRRELRQDVTGARGPEGVAGNQEAAQPLVYYVEFANDDSGPFATRELAEMVARLQVGDWSRFGDSADDDYRGDAQVFASSDLMGCKPCVALVAPRYQSSQVEYWHATDAAGTVTGARGPEGAQGEAMPAGTLVRGFGKPLCPECLWVNLRTIGPRELYCSGCGWEGSIEQTDAPGYVAEALGVTLAGARGPEGVAGLPSDEDFAARIRRAYPAPIAYTY